jgi:hypothetical protein
MSVALILLSLAALCLGTFGWLWLCAGLRREGWRGLVGRLAVQVSALCLIYGLMRGQPMSGLFIAMFPPLAVIPVVQLMPFGVFAGQVLAAAAPYAGAVLVVFLAVGRLRVWAPGAAGVALLLAGAILGDGISKAAMCDAAAAEGFASFQRNGLMWSLANAPQEFQFDLHARAEAGGQVLGWSYSEMGWYVVPAGAAQNVGSGAMTDCGQPS